MKNALSSFEEKLSSSFSSKPVIEQLTELNSEIELLSNNIQHFKKSSSDENTALQLSLSEIERDHQTKLQKFDEIMLESKQLFTNISKDLEEWKSKTVSNVQQPVLENVGLSKLVHDSRINNLVLSNIPVDYDIEGGSFMESIAKCIGTEFSATNLSWFKRLPSSNSGLHPPVIVVSFVKRNDKINFFKSYLDFVKTKALTLKVLDGNYTDRRIFINEHLGKEGASLFTRVRLLKNAGSIHHFFTINSRMMIKLKEEDNPIPISSKCELDKLLISHSN